MRAVFFELSQTPKLDPMNHPQAVNPCCCPLCGQANHCAMEMPQAGREQVPCWCTRETFSVSLLQRVPEPLRGQACICQACVNASKDLA